MHQHDECTAVPAAAALLTATIFFAAAAWAENGGAVRAAAPLTPQVEREIDAVVARQVHDDGPGCMLQVARGETVVFARGYGRANLAYGIPISPATVFPIASNSKEFAAMAILLLAEEGKLSLEDDVRKVVPELPDYGTPIRIRQLIFHTSGVRDYQAVRFLAGVPSERLEREEILGLLTRQKATNFAPGSRFTYSNAGYVLLATIVERVAGKPLTEFAAERIFAPLGMTHTLWTERGDLVIPAGATLYSGGRDAGYRVTTTASLAGSGGVWTTTGDFLHWIANLRQNRLGRNAAELGRKLVARGALDDGTPIDYGFGIFHGEHRGRPILWHGGATAAEWVLFPEQEDLSVVCFCNLLVDSRGITRQVADLLLDPGPPASPAANPAPAVTGASPAPAAGVVTPATAGRTYLNLSSEALSRFVGKYRNPASGTVHRYTVEGGKLGVEVPPIRIVLQPIGADEMVSVEPDIGWRLRFEPAGAPVPQVVRLFEEGVETAHYDRLPLPPPPAALQGYAGAYWSEELRARYQLAVEGGQLVLHTPVQPNGALLYLGGDRFALPTLWFTVDFELRRGPDGHFDGLMVSIEETHIPFRRLPECATAAAALTLRDSAGRREGEAAPGACGSAAR
jgi:CubicO group peptidase (beta-lactamase class C family)